MNAQGTGLGLSICKNIIESMGGQIDVESEEGKGTCFKISIPTLISNELGEDENQADHVTNLVTKPRMMPEVNLKEMKSKVRLMFIL